MSDALWLCAYLTASFVAFLVGMRLFAKYGQTPEDVEGHLLCVVWGLLAGMAWPVLVPMALVAFVGLEISLRLNGTRQREEV